MLMAKHKIFGTVKQNLVYGKLNRLKYQLTPQHSSFFTIF